MIVVRLGFVLLAAFATWMIAGVSVALGLALFWCWCLGWVGCFVVFFFCCLLYSCLVFVSFVGLLPYMLCVFFWF